ncbi:MAG TPA: hypothetical protein VLA89_01635 [Gemmatimonadales bacterium]|nr:hypothetical protein [Gemmatimonadales bacterium]
MTRLTIDDTFITSGNLLTCCVFTLMDLADNNPYLEVRDGMEVACRRSGSKAHRMVLFNRVWRWIDPVEAEMQERDKLDKKGGLWDAIRGRNRT